MEIDKSLMLDSAGKPKTQSLFLEIGYTEHAIYTLKDEDHVYKGVTYPSLKRLYIETYDPTEYEFACNYLLGWRHWKRLCENKLLRRYIEEWREELEVALRCRGVKEAIKSAENGGFQASKWLVDRGWDVRGKGRPSKDEVEREKKFQARIDEEYSADILRLASND